MKPGASREGRESHQRGSPGSKAGFPRRGPAPCPCPAARAAPLPFADASPQTPGRNEGSRFPPAPRGARFSTHRPSGESRPSLLPFARGDRRQEHQGTWLRPRGERGESDPELGQLTGARATSWMWGAPHVEARSGPAPGAPGRAAAHPGRDTLGYAVAGPRGSGPLASALNRDAEAVKGRLGFEEKKN